MQDVLAKRSGAVQDAHRNRVVILTTFNLHKSVIGHC
jgi:hypothetical protein